MGIPEVWSLPPSNHLSLSADSELIDLKSVFLPCALLSDQLILMESKMESQEVNQCI